MSHKPLENTAHCNNHYMHTCGCHFKVNVTMVKAHALFGFILYYLWLDWTNWQ